MKFLTLFLSLLLTSVSFANPVDATKETPVCYAREYSQSHMDKTPAQSVKSFKFKFYKYDNKEEGYILGIDAQLKVKAKDYEGNEYDAIKPYANSMYCVPQGKNKMACGIDCDGGQAEVIWETKTVGDQITFINRGFVMYGGCGEDVDEGDSIWLDAVKGGDDVFKLYRVRPEFCQN